MRCSRVTVSLTPVGAAILHPAQPALATAPHISGPIVSYRCPPVPLWCTKTLRTGVTLRHLRAKMPPQWAKVQDVMGGKPQLVTNGVVTYPKVGFDRRPPVRVHPLPVVARHHRRVVEELLSKPMAFTAPSCWSILPHFQPEMFVPDTGTWTFSPGWEREITEATALTYNWVPTRLRGVLPLRERFPAPAVMGVVNVTPDSFSDGGAFLDPGAAVAHGLQLVAEGADLLDVGGESTRPGSDPVPLEVELERVLPVIERLAGEAGVPVSIDTVKAEVAARAIRAGAGFVNDVSALRHDPAMAGVVAGAGVPVCLMHMLGEPKTMQRDPRYADVVAEVSAFLAERVEFARASGISPDQICIDPGIGFGKTADHNLTLLRHLDRIAALGAPVLVGASRKSFLGVLTGEPESSREVATVAVNLDAVRRGAWMLRVHAVTPTRQALAVAAAIEAAP